MLQQHRKPERKSPFGKMLSGVVLIAAVYVVWSSGLAEKAWHMIPAGGAHDHGDVEIAANVLKDTPECATYRAAILKYRGKPRSDATDGLIEKALDEGIDAGCKKSDLQ